jgi:hypothetical protein
MALTRMRDGRAVPLSPEEEAEVLAEWAAFVPQPPIDLGDVDQLEKTIKALALCIAQIGGLTVPQMKTLFRQKFNSL